MTLVFLNGPKYININVWYISNQLHSVTQTNKASRHHREESSKQQTNKVIIERKEPIIAEIQEKKKDSR